MLEIDSIEFYVNKKALLGSVYLRCTVGKLLGIVGPNGCGKTSLLKILFGTLEPTNKSIRVDGHYTPYPFRKEGLIRLVLVEGYTFPYLRIKKVIDLLIGDKEMQDRILLDEVISAEQNTSFGRLSFGMKRYIEIVLALYSDCKYLLLDDAFYGLSPIYTEKVKAHIHYVNPTKGIILASSNITDLEGMADEVVQI